MAKKLVLIFVIGLLLFQLVSAIDTPITIKTVPNYRVDIRVTNPEGVYINSFYKTSDSSGKVSVTLSSSEDSLKIWVWVKKDGNLIASQKSDDLYTAGMPVSLEVYPTWYTPPESEEEANVSSENENATITENTTGETSPQINNTQQGKGLLSSFIFSEEGSVSKNVIYLAIGAFLSLLFILIFLVMKKSILKIFSKKLQKKEGESQSPPRNFPKDIPKEPPKTGSNDDYARHIAEAERKIKEAQEEIRRIKDSEKIEQVKKKLIEDKKRIIEDERELIRLRQEKEREQNRGY
jgi:hypothetical protein